MYNYLPPIKQKKRVFISFHMDDLHAKTLLVEQAKSDKFDLEFINYSVNTPFDNSWKTQCAERINQASVTICLIGRNTYSRPAVIWELNKSYELEKKVFGVVIYRNEQNYWPEPLLTNNANVYYWNIATIVQELNT